MEVKPGLPHREYFIFVCEKNRPDKKCCMPEGAQLTEKFKLQANALGLASKVRVVRTGCLDLCEAGPNVLVEPSHEMFSNVKIADVETILEHVARRVNPEQNEG